MGLVLHFNTRTKHKTARAALHGGKAITQNQLWQICHSVAAKPHCIVCATQGIGGHVLRPTTPSHARPRLYMLNPTIQHTA